MCGIAGVVGKVVSEKQLRSAAEAMHHRGPDQSGFYWHHETSLAHRRLSIIDLSERGRQPMSSDDENSVIVYNGEIYNFKSLRVELSTQFNFRSNSDTEVLLYGYEKWGISKLLEKINGMFAFAIWDKKTEILHVARDRCGKKPLFYFCHDGAFYFASTLAALLKLLDVTPPISLRAIASYLNYLSIPSPISIFEGVYKLPPASRIEYHAHGKLKVERYWQVNYKKKDQLSDQDWIETIDDLLRTSVHDRLIADVPVGAFLSGGVDSSIVAAIMADISSKKITTISIGFREETFNETVYARQVAEKWQTDHHEHLVEPTSVAQLPKIVHHFGEPFADPSALPCFVLAEMARQHATVVLTGDGGDEGFGGYESARMFALYPYLKCLAGWPMLSVAKSLRNANTKSNTFRRRLHWIAEVYSVKSGNYLFDPIGDRNFRFMRDELFTAKLAAAAGQHDLDSLYTRLWRSNPTMDWADRSFLLDFERKLPNTFLTKVDVTTMAHALEARSPFLDYRVIELAARIPASTKINLKQSKWLLKKVAEKYVPKEVIYRRKQGFSVPLDDWFRNELYEFSKQMLLSPTAIARDLFKPEGVNHLLEQHHQGKRNHGQRIWSMLILEIWFRVFLDRELLPTEDLASLMK